MLSEMHAQYPGGNQKLSFKVYLRQVTPQLQKRCSSAAHLLMKQFVVHVRHHPPIIVHLKYQQNNQFMLLIHEQLNNNTHKTHKGIIA